MTARAPGEPGAGEPLRAAGPVVVVVGVDGGVADGGGAEVARFDLDHGADPEAALAGLGLSARRLVGVTGRAAPHTVELRYAVEAGVGTSGVVPRAVARDEGLVLAPGERPHVFQRVAVYAVVRSERGLLLTQMSDRTNSPNAWGPAGGGLDPGEQPEEALHREVWEEAGQRLDRVDPLRVTTSHWVGRAPSGRLEDFHAVRVIYDAWCAEPTDPVVHDVGGTTQASAWFGRDELAGLTFVSSWSMLPDLLRGRD